MLRYSRIDGFCLLILLVAASARAQLSPGPLSQSHAAIDKMETCKQCHDDKGGVSPAKCLVCHAYLNQQLQAKKGLHANPEYANCIDCHWEHQGRGESIIIWKESQDKFNHQLAGYSLTGKHASLRCIQCHKVEHIKERERLQRDKIDLQKTFLGLDGACVSCHVDEHRGQEPGDCLRCHDMNGWKPAGKFVHDNTAFPLKGKHLSLACEKCHAIKFDQPIAQDKSYLKFSGISHRSCSECHKDPHQGKFPGACRSCHSPEGWKSVRLSAFEHDRTAFPLRGKHKQLECGKCHLPDRPMKIAVFQNCADCHADYHQGQFSKRAGGNRCQDCHSEAVFFPSTFGLARHESSRYPLKGAHRAVPCNLCHTLTYESGQKKTQRFTFDSTNCIDCHADPHKKSTALFMREQQSCLACHSIDGWNMITFDHDRTRFKLEGGHQKVNCRACHKPLAGPAKHDFKDVPHECQDCHLDIHQGQFLHFEKEGSQYVKCTRCHSQRSWKEVNFNHQQDSNYHLEGSHTKVPCAGCHKTEKIRGILTVRYHPIATRCESCHKIVKESIR